MQIKNNKNNANLKVGQNCPLFTSLESSNHADFEFGWKKYEKCTHASTCIKIMQI